MSRRSYNLHYITPQTLEPWNEVADIQNVTIRMQGCEAYAVPMGIV